jgi:hypothetical protein
MKTQGESRARRQRPGEISWTLRLPKDVIAMLDARVAELNSTGTSGRWSRNGLVVHLISKAAARSWSE